MATINVRQLDDDPVHRLERRAARIGAQVVTADGRFAKALAPSEHGGTVVTLADHAKIRR